MKIKEPYLKSLKKYSQLATYFRKQFRQTCRGFVDILVKKNKKCDTKNNGECVILRDDEKLKCNIHSLPFVVLERIGIFLLDERYLMCGIEPWGVGELKMSI